MSGLSISSESDGYSDAFSELGNRDLSNRTGFASSQETRASSFPDYVSHSKKEAIYRVFNSLERENISLLELISDTVAYGCEELRNDPRIKEERRRFVNDPRFGPMLECILDPPRLKSKGRRARTGKKALQRVSFNLVGEILRRELDGFSRKLRAMKLTEGNCFSEDEEMFLKSVSSVLRDQAPTLHRILSKISEPKRGGKTAAKREKRVSLCSAIEVS
jgi:hypothetical protein